MASKGIEAFLDFLREANTQLNIAVMVEQEANDKTQDILHRLELQDHAYHEYAALSKELKAIRKERRNAKDEIACLSPIVEWAQNNQSTVKGLEQLLGVVRKAERSTEQRIYTPRGKRNGK